MPAPKKILKKKQKSKRVKGDDCDCAKQRPPRVQWNKDKQVWYVHSGNIIIPFPSGISYEKAVAKTVKSIKTTSKRSRKKHSANEKENKRYKDYNPLPKNWKNIGVSSHKIPPLRRKGMYDDTPLLASYTNMNPLVQETNYYYRKLDENRRDAENEATRSKESEQVKAGALKELRVQKEVGELEDAEGLVFTTPIKATVYKPKSKPRPETGLFSKIKEALTPSKKKPTNSTENDGKNEDVGPVPIEPLGSIAEMKGDEDGGDNEEPGGNTYEPELEPLNIDEDGGDDEEKKELPVPAAPRKLRVEKGVVRIISAEEKAAEPDVEPELAPGAGPSYKGFDLGDRFKDRGQLNYVKRFIDKMLAKTDDVIVAFSKKKSHSRGYKHVDGLTKNEYIQAMVSGLGMNKIQHARGAVKDGVLRDGLYSDQIAKIMMKFKPNGFIGVVAADELDQLVEPSKGLDKFGFVMNKDTSDKPGSHWLAVYVDLVDDMSVEYYDSFAEEPDDIFLEQIKTLLDSHDLDVYLKFKVNRIKEQAENSVLCGFHAMKFLMDRFNGKPFKECSGYSDVRKQEHLAGGMLDKFDKFGYI